MVRAASSSHQSTLSGKCQTFVQRRNKYKGEPLNGKLLTGPDFLKILIGIIFRFREHQIALTADIEAIFLREEVSPQECRLLRFVWRSKPEDKTGVHQYARQVFEAETSATCANYALLHAGQQREAPNNGTGHQKEFLHG